jgi:hypothetical protein
MKIGVSLIINPNRETKKTRTHQMQDNNSIEFYYKNKIRIEQGCDKKHTQN